MASELQGIFWWYFLERYGNISERSLYQPRLFTLTAQQYIGLLHECHLIRFEKASHDAIFLKVPSSPFIPHAPMALF